MINPVMTYDVQVRLKKKKTQTTFQDRKTKKGGNKNFVIKIMKKISGPGRQSNKHKELKNEFL